VGGAGAGSFSFSHPVINTKAIARKVRVGCSCFRIKMDYSDKNNQSLPAIIG
jgi:hypothetical protein